MVTVTISPLRRNIAKQFGDVTELQTTPTGRQNHRVNSSTSFICAGLGHEDAHMFAKSLLIMSISCARVTG